MSDKIIRELASANGDVSSDAEWGVIPITTTNNGELSVAELDANIHAIYIIKRGANNFDIENIMCSFNVDYHRQAIMLLQMVTANRH